MHGEAAEPANRPFSIGERDLRRMRDQLLFDGPDTGRKLSRFWTLLVLAAIIASAGSCRTRPQP